MSTPADVRPLFEPAGGHETIFSEREVVPQQIGPSVDGVEQRGSIIVIQLTRTTSSLS
jgi:hypothetical protein